MRTDVGNVRARNEDAAFVDAAARFAVLADGMGGRLGGDVASATAVDVVRAILEAAAHELVQFERKPCEVGRRRLCALIDRAVRDANDVVRERAQVEPDHHGMGTTLEVAIVVGHEAFVAHVGDSRTYLIRDGAITQLTEDHTLAEAMRRANTLSDDEARWSPLRSVLTNVIGYQTSIAIEHLHVPLSPGDRVLLCSDGLHDYFTSEELASVAREGTPETAADELIAMARAAGGHDNITAILIEVPSRPAALAGISDDALSAFLEVALPTTGGDQLDADV
jgi:protein phosphatase